jgi:hypothetical protein
VPPAEEDPAKAELVKLRFFGGPTMPEIAEVFMISLATAERHWTFARTWLYDELKDRDNSEQRQEPSKELRGLARVCRIDDSERERLLEPSVSEGLRRVPGR